MQLGPFAGPIWTIILIVDRIFFLFLEWWMPREDLDYVNVQWDPVKFTQLVKKKQKELKFLNSVNVK